MLVYRSYTDGISPIYRWYIAYIPIFHHANPFFTRARLCRLLQNGRKNAHEYTRMLRNIHESFVGHLWSFMLRRRHFFRLT